MSSLIAIGGGSFQRGETLEIDRYAVQRTNKQHPTIVFLPTASKDDQGYAKRFKQYARSMHCEVQVLRLFHTKLSRAQVKEVIFACDMLYLGAGSLSLLMETLLAWDLIATIRRAYEQGVVCMGISAGASAFFTYGYSDVHEDGTTYAYIKGMNIIPGIFCPHAQDEKRKGFYEPQETELEKIACVDRTAYVIEEHQSFLMASK